jgi:hypothetical protein
MKTGKRYGPLILLGRADPPNDKWGSKLWNVRCDCGSVSTKKTNTILRAKCCRCGKIHPRKVGKVPLEYHIWRGINKRCYNEKNKDFVNYGGRGIRVCDKWRNSYRAFITDVGHRPPNPKGFKGKIYWTIGRINNDGDYEPGNVRWETCKQQANNRRPPRRRGKKCVGDTRKL